MVVHRSGPLLCACVLHALSCYGHVFAAPVSSAVRVRAALLPSAVRLYPGVRALVFLFGNRRGRCPHSCCCHPAMAAAAAAATVALVLSQQGTSTLLLPQLGVGRRCAGGLLASTTSSSALCGPTSGIRLRSGVGRRYAGGSLASTTSSSALCGPLSGIWLRSGVGRRCAGDALDARWLRRPRRRPARPLNLPSSAEKPLPNHSQPTPIISLPHSLSHWPAATDGLG